MIGLAKIYLQQNETARALPLLEKAATLQPDNEAAHYALLKAYRNSGNMEQAKEQKAILDRLQKPPDSEFSDFLKKLGDKTPRQ
jgi:Tfp pilus assembly protein PilF